jgi:post-segregation antitoxin (ccd killing protein)
VFSCYNQDQPLDQVDFAALNQRLTQNSLQEKQSAAWLAENLKHVAGATSDCRV